MAQEDGKGGRFSDCSSAVIGACIEVHRNLGPGLLESAYERCLCQELALRGLQFERQRLLPINYKGLELDCGYRLDLVVERELIVELKAVEQLLPIHEAQAITYLKLTKLPAALLVNFNVTTLKHGVRRLSRDRPNSFRSSRLPVIPP